LIAGRHLTGVTELASVIPPAALGSTLGVNRYVHEQQLGQPEKAAKLVSQRTPHPQRGRDRGLGR